MLQIFYGGLKRGARVADCRYGLPDRAVIVEIRVQNDSAEQRRALESSDVGIEGNEQKIKGNTEHNRYVPADGGRAALYRLQRGGQAENQGDITDIAADHVPHRDHAFAFDGRYNADHQFGRRCPEGNDGQADEKRGQAETSRKAGRSLYKPIRTEVQHQQTDDEEKDLDYHFIF